MNNLTITLLIALPIATGVAGYFARKLFAQKSIKSQESKVSKIIEEAKNKEKEILIDAKSEALKINEESKKEIDEKQKYLLDLENKLRSKEDMVDQRTQRIDDQRTELENKIAEIEKFKTELKHAKTEQLATLEKIAKISRDEAKKNLLDLVEKDYKEDLVKKIREMEKFTKDQADEKARDIITTSLQRLASDQTAESTVAAVSIPSDEMKGRIIGREGRNIQTFEKMAGVDVIIDDTPETVVISCFDPIRRQIAKTALEKLVADGRIHPARIEETLEKAKEEVATQVREAGEQAIYETGVAGLHPDLVKILGRLKFRTSYGQNVLRHSIEVCYLAGMIASEMGLDVNTIKKAGLLHDLGKAVDHQITGSHAIIGADIAKKYGLSDEIVKAIAGHHEEIEQTREAIIVQVADAISSSRPGARRESLDSYIKRLEDLENVANSFEGIEKSYAIQAGREIRVLVQPSIVDDLAIEKLARNIARKIEKDLKYPGQIKVNVIRETRAIDIAK
jgi:ribonuclease Y